uniref:Uncharacterized protein n=1 Tax=viral metagenome TaxID=1070528 RepID=A0A6C0M036_9ZZZZ
MSSVYNAGLRRDARNKNASVDTLNVKTAIVSDGTLVLDAPNGVVLGNSTWLSSAPERYQLEEFFKRKPGLNADVQNAAEATRMIASTEFELLGTNATSASSTFSATRAAITLTTAGNANDQVIVLPHLDASQSAWAQVLWGTENQVVWECGLATGASITACSIWAGLKLTNTPVIATDNDQVFFRYDSAVGAVWTAVSSIGGTDTSTATGKSCAINTFYNLRIAIDAARKARFYVDGDLVATTAALTNDVNLIPYVGVMDTAGVAKAINLSYERISRHIFE